MEHKISDLILFNDHQLLVMNKPAGIPTHDDKTKDSSLLKMAQAYCRRDLHVMTRLDRPVGGLILMTKSTSAHKSVEKQREEKGFDKIYIAIVEKGEYPDKGELENYLLRDSKTNKAFIVRDKNRGKLAKMSYETIKVLDNYNILKIKTSTGRFHQIRCQLGTVGIFIKGDVKYGARRGNKDRSIDLHAWKMTLMHPTKNELMSFEAPIQEGNALWDEVKNSLSA